MNISLSTLIQIVNGRCQDSTDVSVQGVSIDTRTLKAGDLYVAIIGEVHDGHKFVAQAVEQGAVVVVAQQEMDLAVPVVIVGDTRLALGRIAAWWRQQFSIPVIGITGSNGKTTVKEICRSILSECGTTLATEKNNNNDIGVPLTLLQISEATRYAVIEMGTNHKGEIGYLAELVRPDIAAITTIGESHLAAFVNREAVAVEKADIYAWQNETGRAILPGDCAQAEILQGKIVAQDVLRFGVAPDFEVSVQRLAADRVEVLNQKDGQRLDCQFSLLGEHNLRNLACAMAIIGGLGLDAAKVANGIAKCRAVSGRLNMMRISDKLLLIDDSYNANPSSVREAINVLAELPGYRILVFGDMGELGDAAAQYHREIGEYAALKTIDLLITTGDLALQAHQVFNGQKIHVEDSSLIGQIIAEHMQEQTVVLVKASRFMKLDTVVNELQGKAA